MNAELRLLTLAIIQEDSILLWQQVCSNKLLSKCPLILFLNKRDILERKLNNGVRFEKYVRSFEGEKNTVEAVTRCKF